jgi:hypothetical protein
MSDTPYYLDDAPRTEIVQWFDDPVWRVSSVPTPVAFGLGLLLGAGAVLLAMQLLDD